MPRNIRIAEPPPRLSAEVRSVKHLGDQIFQIRLLAEPLPWQPGDCVAVYGPDGSPLSRPYSLSGAVGDQELELLVRRFPNGLVSRMLCDARGGARMEISPPFGYFRPALPESADKIYFATGTGIAPFLAACRSGVPLPRRLFWGLRRPVDLELPLPYRCFYSQEVPAGGEQGRVTQVLNAIEVNADTHVYACGLDRMIEEVLGFFQTKNIPEEQLHRECFFTAV